jgi:hypothetical protein
VVKEDDFRNYLVQHQNMRKSGYNSHSIDQTFLSEITLEPQISFDAPTRQISPQK